MFVYKIHPGIGIGRVGNSPTGFFVGPETPGDPGVEIQVGGSEIPMTKSKYKAAGQIKRQAARFRVLEYDQNAATGKLTFTREITSSDAKIIWRVDLVNRKAALDHAPPHNGIDPRVAGRPRNVSITGAARAGLIIHDGRDQPISGVNQSGVVFDQGQFLGTKVFLGELKTDKDGRLMVLGGLGNSASVPPGVITTNFANNDKWHDDVSDGPVTAKIQFPGQLERDVDATAWVTFAPPDFAPGISGIVSLHDVAFQAAIDAGFRTADPTPSFRRHILPMILKAASLRFVNDQSDTTGRNVWDALPRDPVALSDKSATAAALRSAVVDAITSPNLESLLTNAIIPAFLRTYLAQYETGTFDSDLANPLPTFTLPEALDRANLEACIGLNFFPGIEATQTMRSKIYIDAFRFDPAAAGVSAGFLTEVMAVPWQADFQECSGNWWPSQRPDVVMTDPDNIPGSKVLWASGVNSHEDMVAKFSTLPFVVPAKSTAGDDVFIQETP